MAAAAISATSKARVAVLHVAERKHDGSAPSQLLRESLATYVEVHAGGAGALRPDDLVGITRALARNHDLVLVSAAHGLLVPLGRDGWTLADLAWALQAPVVVVTDSGADSVNHTTLALDALASRGLPASVIAIGDGDGDDLSGLPVRLAGRIPDGAADQPQRFRAEAAGWLAPLLEATGGTAAAAQDAPSRPAAAEGPDDAVPAAGRDEEAPRSTVIGKRLLIALVAVFLLLVLLLCAVTNLRPAGRSVDDAIGSIDPGPVASERRPVPSGRVVPSTGHAGVPSRPSAASVCPQNAGTVVATEPDAATTARVNAAWKRIEKWLATHAPRTRASLRPPAPPERIAALQARMSVAFPADLVASLRRHDGVAALDGFDLPPFFRPLPLDEIVGDWEVTCSVLAGGPMDDDWWHRAFVPFATAGDGGCLLVDVRPGGHGRVGEFYPEEGTGFDGWPASIAELLEGVARSLETGDPYMRRYRPVVETGGHLDWTIEAP
ncbi:MULTISPECIES: SMI1/KNR4 family protein [unclassified Micromonospora]|uniref:SMI1/KNR4 family protein n=1 Tax=unclassified Micromonospora TaxID=2617518 RepID=UPI003323BC46